MATLIAARDWADTPLGVATSWPQSLKTITSVVINSPLAMVVLWGPSLIQIYNAAYAEICGDRHPAALGQATRDCWPEVWDFNAPIYQAVHRGEVRSFERQLLRIERSRRLQDAWFDLTYSPVHDETERVGGVLVTVVESTHHVLLARMMKADIAEGERFRSLLVDAPGFVAVMKGCDHIFEFANRSYMRLVGDRPVVGRSVREVFPELLEGQIFFDLLDAVYGSGESRVGKGVPLRLKDPLNGAVMESFVDFIYAPMFGLEGEIVGVFVQGSDATDRMLAEERQTLFNNELNHRVKNTLATVLSMAMLARKSATSIEAFTQSFTDRVGAMAQTHDLLTAKRWAPVQVRDLLQLELAPYMSDTTQVELLCQSIVVAPDAAVSLSLIVHELLTNAAKYGALATPDGRLRVECRYNNAGAVLIWRETLAHILPVAGAAGFGTRLIKQLAKGLGGHSEIELTPKGQHATINFGLSPTTPESSDARTGWALSEG